MTTANISTHTGNRPLSVEQLKTMIVHHLRYTVGKPPQRATAKDYFQALSLSIRQQLIDELEVTEERHRQANAKRICYLSMEFLIGKSLENNLVNLRLLSTCREAMFELGVNLDSLLETEPDAGLGNGGLGRLAACFIDSMATLGLAGYGYGINYEYGLFRQELRNGWQTERPDNWLADGTPWQLERPEDAIVVPLYGKMSYATGRDGETHPIWSDWKTVIGVPHDMPIVGYDGKTVNILRLFSARGSNEFDMQLFNMGDYLRAVGEKIEGENISKVLYPSDAVAEGRELRLIQEYFMVACCVRDVVRRMAQEGKHITSLPDHFAIRGVQAGGHALVADHEDAVADHQIESRDTLPSFHYQCQRARAEDGALRLPVDELAHRRLGHRGHRGSPRVLREL